MKESTPFSSGMGRRERALGSAYLVISLFFLPAWLLRLLPALFPAVSAAQINFVYFTLNFLAIIGIFFPFWKGSVAQAASAGRRILFCAAIGLLSYFLMSLWLGDLIWYLDPDFSNVNDGSVAALARQDYPLMVFGTVFLVPVVEECLYRGLVFGCLAEKSLFLAYPVSVGLFAWIHVMNYIGTQPPMTLILCFVQYLPAGIALGWAYRKSGSIFAPIAMHAIINSLGFFLMR